MLVGEPFTLAQVVSALTLVFSPGATWEKIALANRGVAWVLFVYLLPCLALGLAGDYYGLTRFGEKRTEFDMPAMMTSSTAQKYLIIHALGGLAIVFLAAFFLHTVAQSFNVPGKFRQAFAAIGYAMGPLFLLQALDGIPALNTWVLWAVGASIAARLLYHGVALCLKPEQTKGFGLFIFSVVLVFALSWCVHFAGVQVLKGRAWKSPLPTLSRHP